MRSRKPSCRIIDSNNLSETQSPPCPYIAKPTGNSPRYRGPGNSAQVYPALNQQNINRNFSVNNNSNNSNFKNYLSSKTNRPICDAPTGMNKGVCFLSPHSNKVEKKNYFYQSPKSKSMLIELLEPHKDNANLLKIMSEKYNIESDYFWNYISTFDENNIQEITRLYYEIKNQIEYLNLGSSDSPSLLKEESNPVSPLIAVTAFNNANANKNPNMLINNVNSRFSNSQNQNQRAFFHYAPISVPQGQPVPYSRPQQQQAQRIQKVNSKVHISNFPNHYQNTQLTPQQIAIQQQQFRQSNLQAQLGQFPNQLGQFPNQLGQFQSNQNQSVGKIEFNYNDVFPYNDIRYGPVASKPGQPQKIIYGLNFGRYAIDETLSVPQDYCNYSNKCLVIVQCFLFAVKPYVAKWPSCLKLFVNDIPVLHANGAIASFPLLDITGMNPRTIRIVCAKQPNQDSLYKFVVRFASKRSINEIIKELYNKPPQKEEHFNVETDGICLFNHMTGKKFKNPGKGAKCQHTQVFELKDFIKLRCTRCPICNNNILFDELIYSHEAKKLLDKLTNSCAPFDGNQENTDIPPNAGITEITGINDDCGIGPNEFGDAVDANELGVNDDFGNFPLNGIDDGEGHPF